MLASTLPGGAVYTTMRISVSGADSMSQSRVRGPTVGHHGSRELGVLRLPWDDAGVAVGEPPQDEVAVPPGPG